MKKVDVKDITEIIKDLCIKSCTEINEDVINAYKKAMEKEESEIGKSIFKQLLENSEIARRDKLPICQDTGFTVIYIDIGQEIQLVGGNFKEAVNEGVRQGYIDGYLRKSILKNPLTNPENTKDNTPAIIHLNLVSGDKIKISILPKGGGAENMSRIKMIKPSEGVEGAKKFVIETVKIADANPCPPIVIGVGIGGTFDYAAYLSKKVLLRKLGERNKNPKLAKLEEEWLFEVNKLGIGPAGLGGTITALDLFIEEFPTHMATYPVAVNIQCNAIRVKTYTLTAK